ncbi:MAG: hypothetical protein AB1641_19665 [Thermodesulfobacteriota bacterium]
MAAFPDILAPDDISEELYLPQVRTDFEGNYVQSRPAVSRARRRFTLKWNALENADYDSLETFFLANQGISFTWTHNVSDVVYTVRFSGDSLRHKRLNASLRGDIEITIEEL